MKLNEVLNKKISYQDNLWDGTTGMTLSNALDEIKSGKLRSATENLRGLYAKGDFSNYDINKKRLPAVTFCGYFHPKRSGDCLISYNHLLVLDIDKLDKEQFERVKKILADDEYVFSFWDSPSKTGIKGLVSLDYTFDIILKGKDAAHKIAFKQLVDYFDTSYDIHLDISGSDIPRLCFLSYDPNLVLKNSVHSFEVKDLPSLLGDRERMFTEPVNKNNSNIKNIYYNPKGRNDPYRRKLISDIIKYLVKNRLSITFPYDSWLKVGFAIAESFTYDIGEKYFLALSKLDTTKFNEIRCKQFLKNCYIKSKHKVGFKTIIRLAAEKGFTSKELVRGVPKVASK